MKILDLISGMQILSNYTAEHGYCVQSVHDEIAVLVDGPLTEPDAQLLLNLGWDLTDDPSPSGLQWRARF